jgi:large subunit ribosomal protein L18Ae
VYKEYRDVTLDGAVNQMFTEMAARHRARRSSIRILRVAPVKGADLKRDINRQFLDSKIKFPMERKVYRATDKAFDTTFKGRRPTTIQ